MLRNECFYRSNNNGRTKVCPMKLPSCLWHYFLFAAFIQFGGGQANAQPTGAPQDANVLGAQSGPTIAVHCIDVDQGAAAFVELPAPCGAILIDVGGYGTAASNHNIPAVGTARSKYLKRTVRYGLSCGPLSA